MNNKFWLVWNPQGSNPRYQHNSRQDAETEAERLALQCPGHAFFVLEAICSKKKIQPVETVYFEENDEPHKW